MQVPVTPADTSFGAAGTRGIYDNEDEPQVPGASFMLYSTADQLNRAGEPPLSGCR